MEIDLDSIGLGLSYFNDKSIFKVFSTRNKLKLRLYENQETEFFKEYSMIGKNNVFSLCLKGNYEGYYYTYIIEDKYEVTDPYSYFSSKNSIRSFIGDIKKTDIEDFKKHKKPLIKKDEIIIYEMHIKDYTFNENSGIYNRGKFLGLTEDNTKYNNFSTGLDHLKELGINCVHLMPIYDFISVDEDKSKDFDTDNYNWGYDPELYNSVEGSYSTSSIDPYSRIIELKKLIKKFHEAGIKVILDVVYNHTFKSLDSNLNLLAPNYYYRLFEGKFSNGSGCGNEINSENFFARKLILDSLIYWQKEYMVDGFRFDLMGLIDKETMLQAKKILQEFDPDVILYGEPWTGGCTVLDQNNMSNILNISGNDIGFFNDSFRDAIKGNLDDNISGFISGKFELKNKIECGIAGSIFYDEKRWGNFINPKESINYFNSHDNLIISDRLRLNIKDEKIIEKTSILAFNIIMTSQGIPFFVAGNEFLRDKKNCKNSYNASTYVNAIDWSYKEKYYNHYLKYKKMIEFRKRFIKFFTLDKSEIKDNLKFLESGNSGVIIYKINLDNSQLTIVHNARSEAYFLKNINKSKVVYDGYNNPYIIDNKVLEVKAYESVCVLNE